MRRPGNRAGLTPDQVLNAARDLVRADGVEALTMRRLADRVGVAPNALYSHFPDKAALLDAVLDSLLAEVRVDNLSQLEWRDGLIQLMAGSRDMLLRHADLLPHLMSRPMRGPNASRLAEDTLALLERGGIRGQTAVEALRALLTYTFGSVVLDAPRLREPDAAGREMAGADAFRSRRDLPHVAELAEPLARRTRDGAFETGLGWLVDGVKRGAG